MPKRTTSQKYIFAVGRRREAVARIRLFSGKGETTVNGKPIAQYFALQGAEVRYLRPLKLTGTQEKYFVTARIKGGGLDGQLAAFVHGLARALTKIDSAGFKSSLKKEGLLTRDSRTRERRKVGTGGKARRKKQSPKR